MKQRIKELLPKVIGVVRAYPAKITRFLEQSFDQLRLDGGYAVPNTAQKTVTHEESDFISGI